MAARANFFYSQSVFVRRNKTQFLCWLLTCCLEDDLHFSPGFVDPCFSPIPPTAIADFSRQKSFQELVQRASGSIALQRAVVLVKTELTDGCIFWIANNQNILPAVAENFVRGQLSRQMMFHVSRNIFHSETFFKYGNKLSNLENLKARLCAKIMLPNQQPDYFSGI